MWKRREKVVGFDIGCRGEGEKVQQIKDKMQKRRRRRRGESFRTDFKCKCLRRIGIADGLDSEYIQGRGEGKQ